MTRKLTFIFVLAILFGAFLIVNPYLKKHEEPPTLEDRLPDADFMAATDCIRLAREVSGMMYYYKVSYRDFVTPVFILSQAKNYGVNLQRSTYVFANKDGAFGVLAELKDSTQLAGGIEKLKHFFDVREMHVGQQKVYKIQNNKSYLFYGKNYICFYKGDSLKKELKRIVEAKTDQVSPTWMELINQQKQLNRSVIIYSRLSDFKEMGLDQVLAYPIIDSTHICFQTYIASSDTLPIGVATSMGKNFVKGDFTRLFANIHVDPTYLKQHPEHPLYTYLMKQSARISFPFKDFLKKWDGHLSFQQGGLISIEEKFIESELDDDFNITEVVKSREVKVPGFAVNYSLNSNGNALLDLLLAKGFITNQEGKYHILVSPPLNYKQMNKGQTHLFYATKLPPKMEESNETSIMWTHKGTQYYVTVDSLKTFELYGKLKFSMESILSKKNITDNF
ncbi:MAG TPA: hypothetical protein VKZ44_10270 [Taishania sp.]|nr:hypothetical protein [Taishania sp.]